MKRILLALTDKEDAIRINNFLEDGNYSPYIVTDSTSLINKIRSGYDMLILDIDIAEELELNIVKFVQERNPGMKVMIVSSKEKLEKALGLSGNDGFGYIMKPVNLNELKYQLDRAVKDVQTAAEQPDTDDYFETRFVGKSEKIRKIMAVVRKVAKSESNILITGETGTGKELIARAIHEISNRASKPFIAVNSAAIPENLLESELFGYRKGAYTGAVNDKKGLIELADRGTIFLDEIGDLGLNMQAKLLRVLEYKEIRRLGDENSKKVDIRVLAATNQDLRKAIEEKKFREDLFFRLNVIHIHIPPLRERKEDIPYLIRFFIEKYNKINRRNIVGIDQKARAVLMQYAYPGNVREIENVIQHAFAMSTGDNITFEDLPVYLHGIAPYQRLQPYMPGAEGSRTEDPDAEFSLARAEINTIKKAFDKYGVNHSKVAKVLGISRSTLWRKMKEYGIEV
jgi:DNA-binding NtrC family response regulator